MLCCVLYSVSAWSQHTVKGVVKDKDIQPIVGASVIIRSLQDTLNHKGCITDENGQFTIEKINSGKYCIFRRYPASIALKYHSSVIWTIGKNLN